MKQNKILKKKLNTLLLRYVQYRDFIILIFSVCYNINITVLFISQAKKLLKSSQMNENEVQPLRELAENKLANSLTLEREVDGM